MRTFGILGLAAILAIGCGKGKDDNKDDTDPTPDTDADTDADSDSDADSDTDADSDADTDTDTDVYTGIAGRIDYGLGKVLDAEETDDGGVIMVGAFEPGNTYGGEDLFALKVDGNGDIDWELHMGGAQTDVARSVEVISDGYLIAGSTQSEGSGSEDMLLVRLDKQGVVQWQMAYGTAGGDSGHAIIDTGTSWILGGTAAESFFRPQPALIRVDTSGNIADQKTYDAGMTWTPGFQDLVDVNGGFFMLTTTPACPSCTHSQGWVSYFDDGGTWSWSRRFAQGGVSYLADLIDLGSNSYLGVGVVDNASRNEAWAVKFTVSGTTPTIDWQTAYGGGNGPQVVNMRAKPGTNHAYMSGVTYYSGSANYGWLMEVDGTGAMQWFKEYGDHGNDGRPHVVEHANGIAITNSGWNAHLQGLELDGTPRGSCGTTANNLTTNTTTTATVEGQDPTIANGTMVATTTTLSVSTTTAFSRTDQCF